MKKATIPPPLYDQIQAIAYCFMYQTESAEIVQAVRKENTDEEIRNKINDKQSSTANQPNSKPKYDIYASSITLDDKLFQHKQNWENIILPRLRSFVEMIYEIRKNPIK